MKILLTGFEPFGTHSMNSSEQVVRRLAASPPEGLELATEVLPVHRERGAERLLHALDGARPEAVLLLGQMGGALTPRIERYFVNLLEYPAELGGGVAVKDDLISPDGPAAYSATLPVRAIHEAILAAKLPCNLSLSAGSYFCNQMGYVARDHVEKRKLRTAVGFMHLPFTPDQVVAGAQASMSLDLMCQVVKVALETIAKVPG